ncbi:MAG TPA: fucose isomerase [Clostridia bacterium]|nr:fucose isomerase [Clostridia bacterium]
MKQRIKLGVVCLTRNTFDYVAADELYQGILKDLSALEQIDLCALEQPIMEPDEAIAAGKTFAAEQVDGIAVISGTFHLGHLLLEIKKYADKPVLLWGLPELPYNGGKIRLNSVCGVNLNASNLVKSGITDFTYTIGSKIDEDWVDAIRMIRALKDSHIGILGYRAHGFFNVGVDELAMYHKFGTIVDHFELTDLWNQPVEKDTVEKYAAVMRGAFDASAVSSEKQDKIAELAAKFRAFAEEKNLTAIAVRCWPEFAGGYGIAPCAAMSIVQSDDLLLSCEGDLDCAITMIAHRAAGAKTPFMADLSQVNPEDNSALMWHCGVAPCNLTDGVCACTLDTYHAGGRGVTAGFVMKSGAINMARFDSINGHYRMFNRNGEAVPMQKELTGTYAKVRFEEPMQSVLDTVIYSGLAHHVSMVYGDYSKPLSIFARLKGLEVL